MALSGKISSQPENGWLDVTMILPDSYRYEINSNSTWVSASLLRTYVPATSRQAFERNRLWRRYTGAEELRNMLTFFTH